MEQIMKNKLQDKINRIVTFRDNHEQLVKIIGQTLSNESSGERSNFD